MSINYGAQICGAIFEDVIGDSARLRSAADWDLYSSRETATKRRYLSTDDLIALVRSQYQLVGRFRTRGMTDPAKSSLLNNIGWLLSNAKHVNPNERRFLPSAGNFLHRGITLSRKQYAWLNSIYYRERYGLSRTYWWWWLRALLTGRSS
jgi:hypothetical protein